jgi:DNA-binding transcriptional MerR regulator
MSKRPEALRLADALTEKEYPPRRAAAEELRRLHELNEGLREQNTELDAKLAELERVNAQLLEALEDLLQEHSDHFCGAVEWCPVVKARAAIKAAKGEA